MVLTTEALIVDAPEPKKKNGTPPMPEDDF
jgi:hypothetical protein